MMSREKVQEDMERAYAEGDCAPIVARVVVMLAEKIERMESHIDLIMDIISKDHEDDRGK